jgi:hypothetical protein
MGEDLGGAVPAGTRLLHIGPHKTGTTAIQGAFHRSRPASLAQGVRYAGPNRHPVGAAQAVIAAGSSHVTDAMGVSTTPATAPPPRIELWRRLVQEIHAAKESRVVISSEWFADADDATIERIVEDLGAQSVHVVVTVRPLEKLLPSQWQQYAQAGFGQPYEAWLESMLRPGAPAQEPATPSFWRRHRHDELVRRWARVVGAEHVTVLVADDRDHEAVLRSFERLTGLRSGTLQPEPASTNRSLTAPEIEVVRSINAALTDARITGERRLALGLFGAAAALRLREPLPDEPRLHTPDWASARARELGAEIAAGLRSSGAHVLGDLDRLPNPSPSEAPRAPASQLAAEAEPWWPAIVGAAVLGVATGAGLVRRWPSQSQRRALAGLSAARLREVLASRVRAAGRSPRLLQPIDGERPAGRALTEVEEAALAAMRAALEADGVGARATSGVLEAIRRELPSSPAIPAPGDPAWLAAAAAAVGLARERGLVPLPDRPPGSRRATVETIEVAGVSTLGLAAVLLARGTGAFAGLRG